MKRTAVTVFGIMLMIFMATVTSCSNESEKAGDVKKEENVTDKSATPQEAVEALKPGTGIYAVIDTSMGRIICKLFPDVAPIGVENFVGLAEGTKEFTDPKTREKMKKPYYDGLIFHRIIPDFMVQGGDPLGLGMGGPGYKFVNEVSRDVQFDRPGRLAYANAGPDTNGSQFFITHKATPWLNGGYTIFGQTIQGQDVVDAMAQVKRGPNDKPVEDVVMEKVTIVRLEEK